MIEKEYPNTFETIKKYIINGRPKKSTVEVDTVCSRMLKSWRLVYFDGPSPRVKIYKGKEQKPEITYYVDGSMLLDRHCRTGIGKFITSGEISYKSYYPIRGYPLKYEIPVNGMLFIPQTVNNIKCYMPSDTENCVTRFGYFWYRNLPLGQRWYVTEREVSPYGNFFQHRCKRYLKGTKFFSTECSLCGEDVTKTIDNLEEKIEATRAAFKLKNALGRTW